MRKAEILKNILKRNHGFITEKEAANEGVSSFCLLVFVQAEKLERIERGFYAIPGWPRDEYLLFQRRYPKFIYSYESALYLWGLTDKIITQKIVTGPNGYHPYRDKKNDVEGHFERNPAIYKVGITPAKTIFGNWVYAYDKEKTICDLISRREEIESEVFVKALHAYVKQKDNDSLRLYAYAKTMGIEKEVFEIMEIIDNP